MNDFEYKGWYCFYQLHPKLSDRWFGSNGEKELSAITKKDLKDKITHAHSQLQKADFKQY